MEQKLFAMIFDYSIHERIADNKFIEKVVDYLVDYYDISDYVKELNIIDKKTVDKEYITCGSYYYDKKKISINPSNINYFSNIIVNECDFDMLNVFFLYNSEIVKVILHEFEHAIQSRTIKENIINKKLLSSDYELYLLYISQIFTDRDIYDDVYSDKIIPKTIDYKLYKKLYNYDPSERYAEINSIDKISSVLSDEIIDLGMLCNYYNNNKYYKILKGYQVTPFKNIICPSEIFLKEIGKKSIWKSFDFYSINRQILLDKCNQIYHLDTRIKCGFPISKREFNNYTDKMNVAYKRLTRTK